MTTYEYLVPLPVEGLGQNARGHWAKRSAAVGAYREEVVAVVLRAAHPAAPLRRAYIEIEARYHAAGGPRSVTDAATIRATDRYRPTDPDNLLAACKAAIDALCTGRDVTRSAGVLAGDRARNIASITVRRIEHVETWAEEGVLIRVTGDEGPVAEI